VSALRLDVQDIQGNVLAGFNTDIQVFVALTFTAEAQRAKVAAYLTELAEALTTVEEVREGRALMRAPGARHTWLAVGIGQRVLDLCEPRVGLTDVSFRRGLATVAAAALGDITDPAEWRLGSPAQPVDVLLTIAANHEAAASTRADELVALARGAGFTQTWRESGYRLEGDKEPFGFRDGLSQPLVIGDSETGDTWPGHFLFGYPVAAGVPPRRHAIDPKGLTQNGSLQVIRRLVQNVSGFHEFCRLEAKRLQHEWPGLTGPWLAALLVGRWPSGALASISASEDPGVAGNAFDFSDDLNGQSCPVGAHIRKVNPRRGLRDTVDVPRILRRGIPFASQSPTAGDYERGLMFISFQTVLRDQFEFLTQSWMNSPERPHARAGHDILVGTGRNERRIVIDGPRGPVTVAHSGTHWITATGGAYLFAPGRRGLAILGGKTSTPSAQPLARITTAPARITPRRDGEVTVALGGLTSVRWPLVRLENAAAVGLRNLAQVERLSLAGEDFPTETLDAADVAALVNEPKLAEVAVNGANICAKHVRDAARLLHRLTDLDLRGVDIDDTDVAAIVEAQPGLHALSLGWSAVELGHRFEPARLTAGALDALKGMRSLRALRLRGLPVSDDRILDLPDVLARLDALDVGETDTGDFLARHLAAHGRLRRLAMDRTALTDAGAQALSRLGTLETLDLSWTDVDPRGAGNLPALRELYLTGTRATNATVTALAKRHTLTRLAIGYTSVTPAGMAALRGNGLRVLDVRGLALDETALGNLRAMPGLRELRLDLGSDWSGLAGIEAAVLLTASPPADTWAPRGLRELRLRGSLTPEFAFALGTLEELESLAVEDGAEHLSSAGDDAFRALRRLYVEGAGLDDIALDRLAGLPWLEALFASRTSISNAVVRLAAPLLHTLELRDTGVDDRAVEALASLPRLHCLDIPGTRITDGGVVELARGARNLQSLALDGTQATSLAIAALADANALVELYLYGRSVTEDTVARLAPLERLRELNLVGAVLPDAVLPHISSLSGLRTLRLDAGGLSASAVAKLQATRPDLRVHVAGATPAAALGRSPHPRHLR